MSNEKKEDITKKKYATNPFIKELIMTSKAKKQLTVTPANSKEKFLIINSNSLPGTEPNDLSAFFGETKEVELNEFVKLYTAGVAALIGLGSAGQKVFTILFEQVRGKEGQDRAEITLNYDLIPEETRKKIKLSRTTFFRGIEQLIQHRFLARSIATNLYYINPTYIFNGNRLYIAKEYILGNRNKTKEIPKDEENKKLQPPQTLKVEANVSEGSLFYEEKAEYEEREDGSFVNKITGEILDKDGMPINE